MDKATTSTKKQNTANTFKPRNLWIEIPEKEHELRLWSEAKLKHKCDKMHISHEGNKSDMIQRILEKMYPESPHEYEFKLLESNQAFDFNANDKPQQS